MIYTWLQSASGGGGCGRERLVEPSSYSTTGVSSLLLLLMLDLSSSSTNVSLSFISDFPVLFMASTRCNVIILSKKMEAAYNRF